MGRSGLYKRSRAGGRFMLIARLGILVGVAALFCGQQAFAGDDTVRLLGGVGSSTRPASGDDTVQVCWCRPWRYACAPVCYPPVVCATPAYYAPTYYSTPAPPPAPVAAPAAYYAPLPAAAAYTVPPRSPIVLGIQSRFFSGSFAIRPAARLAAAPVLDYAPRLSSARRSRGRPIGFATTAARADPCPCPCPTSHPRPILSR